jgi:hypothetical protein
LAAGNGENRGMIARTSDGDLYAGKDGNIYKRDQSGNWSQRGENGWNSVDTSKLSQEQQQRLNDARSKQPQSRQTGAQSSNARTQPGTLASGGASQSGRLQPGSLPSAGSGNLARQPGQTSSSLGSGMAGSRASGQMRSSNIDRDVMGGLNRDASARSSGSRSYQSWQGSRGSYSGGGYGGGMRRGGGGRRR